MIRNVLTSVRKVPQLARRFNKEFSTKNMNKPAEVLTQVNGQTINYLVKGSGDHTVICFPGAIGTIWSDFKPQIDKFDDTFKLIAWDPPGYGKSRPPNRKFPIDFFEKDAEMAVKFMEQIGEKKFSVLGWSDGGITGMVLAAKFPESINKLVIWGANCYILPEELEGYEKVRDVSKWSERMRAPLEAMYGSQGFQEIWNGWCDAMQEIYKVKQGDICKDLVKDIKCPTFILHGDKDPMVVNEHPEYLHANIKGSRLHRFPEGKHNIHLKYADEFNELVMDFLRSKI